MIGFDAKRAFANSSGLGNYSRFVIDILSARYPDMALRLYSPTRKAHPGLAPLLARENVSVAFPKGLARFAGPLWRSCGVTADLKADGAALYHGLSNELPLGLRKAGIPCVVTVHDLIFLRYPSFYKALDRAVYARKTRHACAEADRIIAVSQCTKQDLVSFLGTAPEKITVVRQGCDPAFAVERSVEEKAAVTARYGLPERYMLCLGTVESRKNLLLAVKALPLLDKDLHLAAVGRKTAYAGEVMEWAAANGLGDRVHMLSGVPFEDLPALYQSARVFVYPSFFEGFGIPLLEAVTSGVPVVAATGSSLEEAGGPGSLYIDPRSHEQLADAVQRILSDDALRRRMIEDGRAHAGQFAPDVLADQLMGCYESALGGPLPRP